MKRNSFVLYANLKDVLDALTNEQSGILFKAIVDYNNEIEPQIDDAVVKMAFIPIKQALDRNNEEWEEKKQKRSEAGKKGMANRWGNKDNNTITDDNKDNNVITDDNKDNNVIKDKPKKEKKLKPEKLVYGYNGNVRLTADEYAKLCEKYGDDLANEAISYLDLYILDKGNKYKSHYATIMRWVVDAVLEKRTRQQQKPQNTTSINDYLTQRALGGMV